MKLTENAADRFFRCYELHCVAPDQDSLFNLLNSAHSLNDKIQKEVGTDFFGVKEFVAIKALRNLFHHKGELLNEVRSIAALDLPLIHSDLMFLCLVPRTIVEEAISEIGQKYKDQEEPIIREVLHWYGSVVNINPCVFNFAVHVYERVEELKMNLSSDGYMTIKGSYHFEERNNYSHFVSGKISCNAGDVETVLTTVFADVV